MEPEARLQQRDLDGLRAVLNAWDPIGVYLLVASDGGEPVSWPEDEYGCLRPSLISLFRRGASRDEITAFLQSELHHHFGLDATVTDDVVDRLSDWWATAE